MISPSLLVGRALRDPSPKLATRNAPEFHANIRAPHWIWIREPRNFRESPIFHFTT
jgi:hypothetical protein